MRKRGLARLTSVKAVIGLFVAPGDMHPEVAAQFVAHAITTESIFNKHQVYSPDHIKMLQQNEFINHMDLSLTSKEKLKVDVAVTYIKTSISSDRPSIHSCIQTSAKHTLNLPLSTQEEFIQQQGPSIPSKRTINLPPSTQEESIQQQDPSIPAGS